MISINIDYAYYHRKISCAFIDLKYFFESNKIDKMESEISQQIFIYSSLRKGFHQDVFHYITQFFNFVSTAKVNGVLSVVGNDPVATPTTGDNFIKGELYKINKEEHFSWVFGQLDDYEGLDVEQDEQPSYRRELTTVYNDDGSVTQAWIYWFNGDVSGKPVIASGDILNQELTEH